MSKLSNRIKSKPTIFLIGSLLVLIGSIPAFIYCINLNGGSSLGAIFVLMAALIAIVALFLDYALVKFINHYLVSAIELFLVALIYLLYLSSERKATVYSKNIDPYFIVIYDPSGIKIDQFKSEGLFNKKLEISNKHLIYLDGNSFIGYNLEFDGGDVQHFGNKPEYNFDWTFIYNSKTPYSNRKIDSLVAAELKTGQELYNPNFKGF